MKTKQSYLVTGSELEEKRTKFLQARCAEKQYFGMSNVVGWLLKQRHLERPTDIEAWTRIILQNANVVGSDVDNKSLPELLCNHGLRLDEVNLSKEEHPSIGIHTLVDNVFGDLTEAYVTDSGLLYLSLDGTEVIRFEGNERGGTFDTHILISDVLESALKSWRSSNQHHRPMTDRNFICSWLGRRVQYVLDEAGKEFDAAVAVTEDGTKIVSADWVILSRWNGTFCVCRKEMFTQDKIVRDHKVQRTDGVFYGLDPVSKLAPSTVAMLFKKILRDGRFARQGNQCCFSLGYSDKDVCHSQTFFWCYIGLNNFPEGEEIFV